MLTVREILHTLRTRIRCLCVLQCCVHDAGAGTNNRDLLNGDSSESTDEQRPVYESYRPHSPIPDANNFLHQKDTSIHQQDHEPLFHS